MASVRERFRSTVSARQTLADLSQASLGEKLVRIPEAERVMLRLILGRENLDGLRLSLTVRAVNPCLQAFMLDRAFPITLLGPILRIELVRLASSCLSVAIYLLL